jgi:hypothetical protein
MVAAPLTLRSIQTRAVEVPMARALGTSAQTMNSAPILLIDMQTEEGRRPCLSVLLHADGARADRGRADRYRGCAAWRTHRAG